jgi:uncharacterized protein (UPF0276 family)
LIPPPKDEVTPTPVPARAGIGLRAEHYHDILDTLPDVGWLEVHSENYFGEGGRPLHYLEKLSEHYPISLHGVGLSIGSTDQISLEHLAKLKHLINQFQPGLVSEHLSWGSFQGRHFNDLFPMPYTSEALEHMIKQVSFVQDYLGRQILIENVSSYLEFDCSTIPEWEFITELSEKSGCGILLDVNNIYVNACNHQFNANDYIDSIPKHLVKEIHLAGHTVKELDSNRILIDTHNQLVTKEVWALYRKAIRYFGEVPTLVEWDTDLPKLEVLLGEAQQAEIILQSFNRSARYEHIA